VPGQMKVVFLSRLCGGERLCTFLATAAAFLSRLCGGERVMES